MVSFAPGIVDIALAAGLGLLGIPVGVVASRLVPLFHPHEPEPDDDSRPPPPSCPHCGEHIPFSRWVPAPRRLTLPLRARCPHCGSIPHPALSAVWLTAVAFAFVGLASGPDWGQRSPLEIVAQLFFCAAGVLLGVVDARVKRLPNAIVGPSYPVALVLLAAAAVVSGDYGALVGGLIGLVGLTAFYAVLWFIYPAGMGWGDVKLAGLVGLYLGWEGLGSVISATFLACLLMVVLGLTLIVLGRATRKSELPFGPFMILGALAVILLGDPLPLLFG